MVRTVLVAPTTCAPFLNHWHVSGPPPPAVTLKFTVPPAATVWFVGRLVKNTGATTYSAATLLVRLP